MRKIMIIAARDMAYDARYIRENSADNWYVLNNQDLTLSDFLSSLHDSFALPSSRLHTLKICRNLQWTPGKIRYANEKGVIQEPASIIDLLKLLRIAGKHWLDFSGADNALFAEIMQQLVYLEYPLESLVIGRGGHKGRGEELAGILAELTIALGAFAARLEDFPATPMRENTLFLLSVFMEYLARAQWHKFKLGLAASKKSGKSTLLNALLGQSVAPANMETASPNTIRYKKGAGPQYRLIYESVARNFPTAAELRKYLAREFHKAQKDKASGFALPDMEIEFPKYGLLAPGWQILDTPGPDAAGARHDASAHNALKDSDAAIFLIDYSKSLTGGEINYLAWLDKTRKNKISVYALNKLDLAWGEPDAKSWIKSVDLIRQRLRQSYSGFAECVIFPVSARLYDDCKLIERDSKLDILRDYPHDLMAGLRRLRAARVLGEDEKTLVGRMTLTLERLADLGAPKQSLASLMKLSGVENLAAFINGCFFSQLQLDASWRALGSTEKDQDLLFRQAERWIMNEGSGLTEELQAMLAHIRRCYDNLRQFLYG